MVNIATLDFTSSLFFSIGLILIFATILAYFARLLKQPLIPAYVLAGVLIGPFGFQLIKETNLIVALSEIGIAFLLFIVGLEINLKRLKEVGVWSSLVGIIQVAFIFFVGLVLSRRLGFSNLEALYLGLILTFSSTMIVLKLLSDKNELETLHGRIVLAILLIQDLVVIFALSFLGNISNFSGSLFLIGILKGIFLLLVTLIAGRYLLPMIFNFAARSQELLFLSSIAVSFVFSLFAYFLGFSIAIGAFLAGVALGSLPYHFDIAGKIIPLKDFFVTLFFVSLGMELVFFEFGGILIPLILFLVVVIILKPLIILVLSSLVGYKKRTGFLSAISLAQISEFSLILAALGINLGHISGNVFTLTVLLAVITITLTSYFIKYDNKLYGIFSNSLNLFEKISLKDRELEHFPYHGKKDIILLGAHRMGDIFIREFSKIKEGFVVVDFNPELIKGLIQKKIPCIYGDVANEEVLKRLNLHGARLIISTIPDFEDNVFLIKYIKHTNPKAMMIVTAHSAIQALELYRDGADYVIVPHLLSGEVMAHVFEKLIKGKENISELRIRHINHLRNNKLGR